jgi:hypothetical protein
VGVRTSTTWLSERVADRNFVYYGDNKDWLVSRTVGSKVNVTTGVSIQIAIGV